MFVVTLLLVADAHIAKKISPIQQNKKHTLSLITRAFYLPIFIDFLCIYT